LAVLSEALSIVAMMYSPLARKMRENRNEAYDDLLLHQSFR